MRQKCGDVVGSMGRQAIEDVIQIDVRIVAIELRGAVGAYAGSRSRTPSPRIYSGTLHELPLLFTRDITSSRPRKMFPGRHVRRICSQHASSNCLAICLPPWHAVKRGMQTGVIACVNAIAPAYSGSSRIS